eukprot:scaffold5464_cov97-Skeletonema_dohrnii-CCMP3373.AAC.7
MNFGRFSSAMNRFQKPPQEQEDFPTNVPVPTFRHGNRLLEAAGIGESEHADKDKVDAFLLYSNDEVRMRTLSSGLVGVGADQESTSTETEGEGGTRKRKTRVSFELHPSVFIENLLLAGDDFFVSEFDDINDNEDEKEAVKVKAMTDDINDNEEDAVEVKAKAMTEDPQMNALASLQLFITSSSSSQCVESQARGQGPRSKVLGSSNPVSTVMPLKSLAHTN